MNIDWKAKWQETLAELVLMQDAAYIFYEEHHGVLSEASRTHFRNMLIDSFGFEKCEACPEPARQSDDDGVMFCRKCWAELQAAALTEQENQALKDDAERRK